MNYGYIYKTTNRINGKVYIGQKKGQFNPNYFGSGVFLKRSLVKNGKGNFKIEVIANVPSKEMADEFERFLIAKYREIIGQNNMFNLADGGDGCSPRYWKGKKHTPEYKQMMSERKSGKNHHLFGKKHSLATREKMSMARKGIQYSDEYRIKMSESITKMWQKRKQGELCQTFQ